MEKVMVALAVMLVLLPSFGVLVDPTCDYVAESKWREPDSYEPVRTTIDQISSDNKDDFTPITITICEIKTGEKCFPDDDSRDKNGEFQRLYKFLQKNFLHPKNRLENIYEVDDYLKKEKMASRFRSMSCENKLCNEHGRCGSCFTSPHYCPDIFPYGKIVQDFHEVEFRKEEKRKEEEKKKKEEAEEEKKRRKEEAEAALAELFEKQKREIDELDCEYVTQFKKHGHVVLQVRPMIARIEVAKNGGEFLIGICGIPDGTPCFPSTEEEFMAFKAHIETAQVLINDNRLFEPNVIIVPSETSGDGSEAIRLKSWNCRSSVCDPKTVKCRDSYGSGRSALVWKLHEYMSKKSTGDRTSRTKFLPLISVIIFVQVLFM